MAKPRIFVSSTFFDLKTIRANLERFIKEQGYEPVLFERGSVPYGKDEPLDEYCYREINSCDMVVAIIGGKYGSKSSSTEYSITQNEIREAVSKGKQIYIFVDKSVETEYHTYLANKDVSGFKAVSVDNVKIFEFIESIYALKAGNPVYGFETSEDIVRYLKEQWSGLFQRLLTTSSKLADFQVANDLRQGLDTLKTILTAIDKNNSNQTNLDEIWLLHHPAFNEIKRILDIRYRVVFLNLDELSELLRARNFIRDENITEEFYDFDHKRNQSFIRIDRDIFDESGNLKRIIATDWRESYITLYERPSDDDIPF
ncbi:DUF4062 domain-containing protein [Rahnella aceris]|uniref:DUF4062 domain-containing protein n=1 Tax=Rahnella sp. (strain Y9602) TaxID=2703885 RepID=UPI001C2592E0|nr:DUF4062 domain-containing protein [Rahnella aceris]MBU9852429.1 DUF4062 domain-containing protein [Rahnella aceris]